MTWQITYDKRYKALTTVHEHDRHKLVSMMKSSAQLTIDEWIPIEIKIKHEYDEKTFELISQLQDVDIAKLSLFLACNMRAMSILMPLVKDVVSFLPLKMSKSDHDSHDDFWIMYVNNTIDCLDQEKSQKKFLSDGRVLRIKKFAFLSKCIEQQNIFQVPEANSEIFVSDEFKQVVEKNDLKGLTFESVSSE